MLSVMRAGLRTLARISAPTTRRSSTASSAVSVNPMSATGRKYSLPMYAASSSLPPSPHSLSRQPSSSSLKSFAEPPLTMPELLTAIAANNEKLSSAPSEVESQLSHLCSLYHGNFNRMIEDPNELALLKKLSAIIREHIRNCSVVTLEMVRTIQALKPEQIDNDQFKQLITVFTQLEKVLLILDDNQYSLAERPTLIRYGQLVGYISNTGASPVVNDQYTHEPLRQTLQALQQMHGSLIDYKEQRISSIDPQLNRLVEPDTYLLNWYKAQQVDCKPILEEIAEAPSSPATSLGSSHHSFFGKFPHLNLHIGHHKARPGSAAPQSRSAADQRQERALTA